MRVAKAAIVVGSTLGASAIALIAIFDPGHHIPAVSLAGVGIKGGKITMDSPKISGLQQGGGPYAIQAKTGVQEISTPSIMDLLGVDSHIGMSDGTMTHLTAKTGRYNSKMDSMALNGDVKIANTSGYTLDLHSVYIDFKNGTLTSRERTRVDVKGGEVFADAITIANSGHQIRFDGHVTSTFQAQDDAADGDQVQQAEAEVP